MPTSISVSYVGNNYEDKIATVGYVAERPQDVLRALFTTHKIGSIPGLPMKGIGGARTSINSDQHQGLEGQLLLIENVTGTVGCAHEQGVTAHSEVTWHLSDLKLPQETQLRDHQKHDEAWVQKQVARAVQQYLGEDWQTELRFAIGSSFIPPDCNGFHFMGGDRGRYAISQRFGGIEPRVLRNTINYLETQAQMKAKDPVFDGYTAALMGMIRTVLGEEHAVTETGLARIAGWDIHRKIPALSLQRKLADVYEGVRLDTCDKYGDFVPEKDFPPDHLGMMLKDSQTHLATVYLDDAKYGASHKQWALHVHVKETRYLLERLTADVARDCDAQVVVREEQALRRVSKTFSPEEWSLVTDIAHLRDAYRLPVTERITPRNPAAEQGGIICI